MRWNQLTDISQVAQINELSKEQHVSAVLVFKHSTRCSISSMALNRMENKWQDKDNVPCYFLDLLSHRDISAKLADTYHVEHQSPQVLLIRNGTCFYHNSHNGISVQELNEVIATQIQ